MAGPTRPLQTCPSARGLDWLLPWEPRWVFCATWVLASLAVEGSGAPSGETRCCLRTWALLLL